MFERVQKGIFQDCRLDSTRIVVVGVSGGPDSLCLLDILRRAGLPVLVAHLNHGLRPEAGEDEAYVRLLAERLGLPNVTRRAAVAAFARQESLSIEEAARILRYRFLFEEAERLSAQAVAVAHSANDQVETVLMHLLRGAGLAGLRGMEKVLLPNPWSQDIPLVRPLLEVWREEILSYCQEHGLLPVWDHTNQETVYLRNRIRQELVPFMETYNPQLQPGLLRMAQLLRDDYQIVEEAVLSAWQACLVRESSDCLGFSYPLFCRQQPGVQRGLIRKAFSQLSSQSSELGFEEVERALEFAQNPAATHHSGLAAGLGLVLEGEVMWLKRDEADLPLEDGPQIQEEAPFPVPGSLDLPGGWHLTAELVEAIPELLWLASGNTDPHRAWVDAGLVENLSVRPRRPGDRFQPLGMEDHSLKLSDFMVNVRLPRRLRRGWPLLCTPDQIVWVPGYALAHPFRLTENTDRALLLHLTKKESTNTH